MIKQNCLQE